MKVQINTVVICGVSAFLMSCSYTGKKPTHSQSENYANETIKEQRRTLASNTEDKGFGPQSPRNIDVKTGNNDQFFNKAPKYTDMNLCNIHFHKNAEHKGGEYTKFVGPGDGSGWNTGYAYSGELTAQEKAPFNSPVCPGEYGSLKPGDTVELHYVHSSAKVNPGPTLGSCLSEAVMNPQLRVEGQVFVLVNDKNAMDFNALTKFGVVNGKNQALNIPENTGEPVVYAGSTTGPNYNEKASPLKVTWSMRPKVAKVNIASVGKWCEGNAFNEKHAHGVRNLVINPDLLSTIK